MKAWTLLFLRFGTGMLLVRWGIVRLTVPEAGAEKYLLDPFGKYLLQEGQLLFFPSVAMAAATLVLIAFRSDDRLTLDTLFKRD